jgi:NAD(P)H-dependent flavin oxidoreductase YrpB (nitropropane dioxygenase family)
LPVKAHITLAWGRDYGDVTPVERGGHGPGWGTHHSVRDGGCGEIRKAKEKTQGIVGVNIMVALTHFADLVKTAIAEKIDIIFAGAGLPLDLPGFLKKGDRTRLVPIVSSGRAAALICKRWFQRFGYLPDGFVVEGPKAGGHLGSKPIRLTIRPSAWRTWSVMWSPR